MAVPRGQLGLRQRTGTSDDVKAPGGVRTIYRPRSYTHGLRHAKETPPPVTARSMGNDFDLFKASARRAWSVVERLGGIMCSTWWNVPGVVTVLLRSQKRPWLMSHGLRYHHTVPCCPRISFAVVIFARDSLVLVGGERGACRERGLAWLQIKDTDHFHPWRPGYVKGMAPARQAGGHVGRD